MSIYDDLSKPFPKELHKQLSKGGANLTYIPVSEVIARLNEVLGVDGWSYTIKERWSTGDRDGWPLVVMAHVQLTIIGEARFANREGIGGVSVKFTSKGVPVDLGDEWKGAVSDALKKAAQACGVALDLARSDEALALANAPKPDDPIDMDKFSDYCTSKGVDPLDVIAHAAIRHGERSELTNADKPVLIESLNALAALK